MNLYYKLKMKKGVSLQKLYKPLIKNFTVSNKTNLQRQRQPFQVIKYVNKIIQLTP